MVATRTRIAVAIGLVLLLALPWLAAASDPWTFQGTGWKLLRVDSPESVDITFLFRRGEGYGMGLHALYSENGTFLSGHPGYLPDVGPGVYAHVNGLPRVEVAPNPPHTTGYGGSRVTVPPGVHYLVIGVAGEISHWKLDAPNSVIVDEGPTHYAFVAHMDGGPAVEANAWVASASIAQDRSLAFEVEGALLGAFGLPAGEILTSALRPATYESGEAAVLFPNGTRMRCPCLYSADHFLDAPPGPYVYEDDRTMLTQYRFPVAFWADVRLPFA